MLLTICSGHCFSDALELSAEKIELLNTPTPLFLKTECFPYKAVNFFFDSRRHMVVFDHPFDESNCCLSRFARRARHRKLLDVLRHEATSARVELIVKKRIIVFRDE